jgi:predicted nucleotidyltransferase
MTSDPHDQAFGTTDPALAAVVQRLVAVFHPQKVYLFGSHARGDTGPDSDYDLMLVMSDDAPAKLLDPRTACEVLRGTGIAADVLLWRRSNFDRRLHLRASLPATIAQEGKLLYAV